MNGIIARITEVVPFPDRLSSAGVDWVWDQDYARMLGSPCVLAHSIPWDHSGNGAPICKNENGAPTKMGMEHLYTKREWSTYKDGTMCTGTGIAYK